MKTMVMTALGLMAAGVAQAATVPTSYYVSPKGSDSNNGLTIQTAFKTLEKARAGMVSASKIKRTYLLGGVYQRTSTLTLSQDDSGETWRNYPGQVPIVDGGGSVPVAMFLSGASNVMVYGVTFQNFVQAGLQTHNVTQVVFKDDTILNTMSTGWVQGGINIVGTFTRGLIQHNLIQNANYNGISLAPDQSSSISGTVIRDNAVFNVCRAVADCGAIYAEDPAQASTYVQITHNLIGGFGNSSQNTHGIYLDNLISNVKVTDNVVYGGGLVGFIINGGHGNQIENNVFDISLQKNLALYQQWGKDKMLNNSFRCNVVYSAAKPPAALWQNIGSGWAPQDSRNTYWDVLGQLPNLGIADNTPVFANPSFASPSAGNYTVRSALPSPACYQPISYSGFGPEPGI